MFKYSLYCWWCVFCFYCCFIAPFTFPLLGIVLFLKVWHTNRFASTPDWNQIKTNVWSQWFFTALLTSPECSKFRKPPICLLALERVLFLQVWRGLACYNHGNAAYSQQSILKWRAKLMSQYVTFVKFSGISFKNNAYLMQ